MPLLAVMYPRGAKVKDQYDVEVVAHAAAGAEQSSALTCTKTNDTGSPDTFKTVVEGCPIPVIIAGGPKVETDEELLTMGSDAISVGGKGVAIGGNVFQHDNPTKIVRAIASIVHEKASVNEALTQLKG